MTVSDSGLLAAFEAIAVRAGRLILDAFHDECAVETKPDLSPVTWADREAERIILAGLAEACPQYPVVAEEAASAGILPMEVGDAFLLVDPLDGTKEFVGKNTDFTVNIALVRNGAPVVGIVYAPARRAYCAGRPGEARLVHLDEAFAVVSDKRIAVREPALPLKIVASRSNRTQETDAYIARYPGAEIVSVGSSLKFLMLSAGQADLYPRFGRTMQWDTAAGDAVLRAAGGTVTTVAGLPLTYGPREGTGDDPFANPWFIASTGRVPDAA